MSDETIIWCATCQQSYIRPPWMPHPDIRHWLNRHSCPAKKAAEKLTSLGFTMDEALETINRLREK